MFCSWLAKKIIYLVVQGYVFPKIAPPPSSAGVKILPGGNNRKRKKSKRGKGRGKCKTSRKRGK